MIKNLKQTEPEQVLQHLTALLRWQSEICNNQLVLGNCIAKTDTLIAVVMLKYATTHSCLPPHMTIPA